jgi:hypothetical protein
MQTHTPASRAWLAAPLLLAPFFCVEAAEPEPIARIELQEPKRELNRFSIGYSAGLNIDAHFTRLGARRRGPGPGPATGGGIDRFYDDGYNRVDDSGNQDGLTYYWGYQNASQAPGNDTLLMHSTSAIPARSRDNDGDPQHGFLLTWNRELCRAEDDRWRCGVEVAFGWNDIKIHDRGPIRAGTSVLTDTYDLGFEGGPPAAPYNGTPTGPGPVLSDTPSSRDVTRNAGGARIAGPRKFDADLFLFHVGPYIEFPIVEKLRGTFSGGVAFGVLDGRFSIDERTSIGGGPVTRTRSTDHETGGLIGGYGALTLLYPIYEQWSAFASGQFQATTDYSTKTSGRKVTIDMTATPFVTAGISYSF